MTQWRRLATTHEPLDRRDLPIRTISVLHDDGADEGECNNVADDESLLDGLAELSSVAVHDAATVAPHTRFVHFRTAFFIVSSHPSSPPQMDATTRPPPTT